MAIINKHIKYISSDCAGGERRVGGGAAPGGTRAPLVGRPFLQLPSPQTQSRPNAGEAPFAGEMTNEKYGKCTGKISNCIFCVSPRISLRKFDYAVGTRKKVFVN